MRKIKLILTYEGAHFSGYELQPGKKTIRGELENALHKLFKTPLKTISASRTDAGVHALAQVVGFQLNNSIPTPKIASALNSCLPDGIKVVKAEEVGEDFHARYGAKSKEYEYLIYNGDIMPPFYEKLAWQMKYKLDLVAMRKAANILKGKHDFKSFCASRSDDKDFVRTMYLISIRKRKIRIWNGQDVSVISIRVKGNGFLYKMVRNMVGTLAEVGLGRTSLKDVRQILSGKDRKLAGRTAPADGLCLLKV
ncbi:MAG: tRNA pseudouridine(38-40) synthase TruA, partial [Candidatus Margulisbacteria bacterium]|nr:tRNA pseudouridine(38-40) synthase TruA [Candidatus Margulisiibacteriota bacterium]